MIWDLKNNREAISIVSQTARPHVSATAWNPASPMQIVTASEDDYDPTLLVWDLRNARYESTNAPKLSSFGALTGRVASSSGGATFAVRRSGSCADTKRACCRWRGARETRRCC